MEEGKEISDESENQKPDEDEEKMGSEKKEQGEEENEGKELVEKKGKPSIVKPDLREEKQTPSISPKSSKADENKFESTIKPTNQTTVATTSKEREKRDEESDEQKLADKEDEDTAGKLIQSREEAVAKEREMEEEGVSDEKGYDESEDTLDDEEKVQKSLNLPVDDRIRMQPQLEGPAKKGHEEKPRGYKYISNLSKEKVGIK